MVTIRHLLRNCTQYPSFNQAAIKLSSPTLSRLGGLPTELQMHIWKYAASQQGSIELSPLILRLDLQLNVLRLEWAGSHLIGFFARKLHSRLRETAEARSNLLVTCRITRQMSLEDWKRDVEAISIPADIGGVALPMLIESRASMMKVSDALIGRAFHLFTDTGCVVKC